MIPLPIEGFDAVMGDRQWVVGWQGNEAALVPPRPRATGGQWAGLDVAVLLDGAQGKTLEDAVRGRRRRRAPREEDEEEGCCTGKNLKEEGRSAGKTRSRARAVQTMAKAICLPG
jgi:hypothetical protein